MTHATSSVLTEARAQGSIADAFQTFLSNLAVDNAPTISLRYGEITAALNKTFRDTESKTANNLQVGSYGRRTAIKGISDLDMLYVMPAGLWDTYKDGGSYRLLRAAADAICARYPNTEIFVDRLVVRVLYSDFHIEVQPVFEQADGSFKYPDTAKGGSWKITKPRDEIAAMSEVNEAKNRNLRRLCKMARAWKNKHGVGIGGLLIDTLAHKFLTSTTEYDSKSYLYYDYMSRDFFLYLSGLPRQDYFAALGSGQRVKVKKQFQKKAKKAYDLCVEAIDAEGQENRNDKWRKVYGRAFPARAAEVRKAFVSEASYQAKNTEEFVDEKFRVDVRHSIELECEISQNGFREMLLRDLLARCFPLLASKSLRFYVAAHDIDGTFELYWKVLNRGPVAVQKDMIRGQIVKDHGHLERKETTNFKGDHVVECYAVRGGVVIATDRIHVPISA